MASMADDFKALRGGEGVTGSAHSGGGIEGHGQRFKSCLHGMRRGQPTAWTDGDGDFISAWQCGPTPKRNNTGQKKATG
jgi:hypothetical protein